jgi:hypothetical protein
MRLRARRCSQAAIVGALVVGGTGTAHAGPQWVKVTTDGGALCTGREQHSATAIGPTDPMHGAILIVGGLAVPQVPGAGGVDAGDDADIDGGTGTYDATLPQDGSAGGGTPQPTDGVELYDPSTSQVTQCTSLLVPRVHHTATWVELPVAGSPGTTSGVLLVVGGYTSCQGRPCAPGELGPAVPTYELYDPQKYCTGMSCLGCSCPNVDPTAVTFPLRDGLPRAEHTATVMPATGNNVLIAGGTFGDAGTGAQGLIFDTSIPFDPANPNASWRPAGPQFAPTFGQASTYVADPADQYKDVVLFVGGSSQPAPEHQATSAITSSWLFTVSGGSLTSISRDGGAVLDSRPAGTVSTARLDGASVLVWGGDDWTSPVTLDFTAYFQTSGSVVWKDVNLAATGVEWTKQSASVDTSSVPKLHGALMVGGIPRNTCAFSPNAAYLGVDGWNAGVASLNNARVNHTVTPFNGGHGLVAIGGNGGDSCFSSELLQSIEILSVLDLGDACHMDAECVTGHCADGVCCESACTHAPGGDCRVCNAQGACGAQPAGTACGQPNACGGRGSCNGQDVTCPAVDAGVCAAVGPQGDASMDAAEDVQMEAAADVIEPEAAPSGPGPSESYLACSAAASRGGSSGRPLVWLVVPVALAFGRAGRRAGRRRGAPLR